MTLADDVQQPNEPQLEAAAAVAGDTVYLPYRVKIAFEVCEVKFAKLLVDLARFKHV